MGTYGPCSRVQVSDIRCFSANRRFWALVVVCVVARVRSAKGVAKSNKSNIGCAAAVVATGGVEEVVFCPLAVLVDGVAVVAK